jgi:homoserine O-acetyltransferase
VLYRTFGVLSQARDNAVLIPTWLGGRSADWIPLLGAKGLVDTTAFFVIVADALGNGVSSSPSNSPTRPGALFPALTISDMVESQHRLLTERLAITHLRAVVGVSMGGMQALEWATRYPTFMDRIVSIVGSPRIGAYDRVLWEAVLSTIEGGPRSGVPIDSVWVQFNRLLTLHLSTPIEVNRTPPLDIEAVIAEGAKDLPAALDLADFAVQTRAVLAHDVARAYDGDLARAAAAVRARVLAVYSWDDHTVSAQPAAAFAQLVGADTLSILSECGHGVFSCEAGRIGEAIARFLAR